MLRAVGLALGLAIASPAFAQHAPITNRDYAIDLYDGVALGDSTMVGMGGAGEADVIGTAGVLLNPSAIAVRPTMDHDAWSFDYHLDWLTGSFSSDYDNNGQVATGGASMISGGLGGRYHDWGFATTITAQSAPIGDSDTTHLSGEALRVRFVVARWFPSLDLAVGAGVQVAQFNLDQDNDTNHPLFRVSGLGAIAGATWLPAMTSLRLAASIDGPVDGNQVDAQDCDPANCRGYILPDHVRAPWRAVGGVAYRLADTAWNQQVPGPFRDERALTFALDTVVTGGTPNGYGIEAFGMQQLQRSGRHSAVSVRGGLDFEAIPGRLRLRAGSYWEPARFIDVDGRLHGTFGIDVRVFAFQLWGRPRRGRISALADIASRYRNIGASIGFWH